MESRDRRLVPNILDACDRAMACFGAQELRLQQRLSKGGTSKRTSNSHSLADGDVVEQCGVDLLNGVSMTVRLKENAP